MNSRDTDSARVLQILLNRTTPEERERLRVAWERHAHGDPESLPAIYALADRFSLTAHAALLERQEKLLESFQEQRGGISAPPAAGRKSGVRLAGVLCCLAAGVTGAALGRRIPSPPTPAGASGQAMMEEIKAAGGELIHYVSRRDGRMFHVLELRSASPPEAYITPERHGVIVFENQPAPPRSQ